MSSKKRRKLDEECIARLKAAHKEEIARIKTAHKLEISRTMKKATKRKKKKKAAAEGKERKQKEVRQQMAALPLLSTFDPDTWVGRKVRIESGRAAGDVATVLRSGNGWVQLRLKDRDECAKRPYELHVVNDDVGP